MATVEEYRAAVVAAGICADMLAQHDISQILQEIDRADAVGPVLDPTLWRDKHKAMAEDREILSAALKLSAFGRRR